MGLITKTVKVKWIGRNKKHYVDLGYEFTKMGDMFDVKIEDLQTSSNIKIKYTCDSCGKECETAFINYNRRVHNDGNHYCNTCSIMMGKLKKSKSFEQWCIEQGRQDILDRWDYELNNCKPNEVSYSSSKKYWFKCNKHPEHKSELKNLNNFIQGQNGSIECNQCNSFAQWCINNNRQDVLDRWDYELNNFTPWEVSYSSSSKKYWFKCNKHFEHKSELKKINDFTQGCEGSIECNQCNSLAQWILDNNLKIEDYWEYDKNIISPWNISHSSKTKVWIKCQEKNYHGSYKITCDNFTTGNRCPYCSGRKIHPKDSLGQYIIDYNSEEFLWKIWSDKNNNKSPFEYAPQSMKEVWWKCLDNKHEDYKRSCNSSYTKDFRCPQCSNERKESLGEEKVRLYLKELGYKVLTEYNCTIRPINPKTKYPLPYDNEIILDDGEHLIIEVHGDQHYNLQTGNSKWIKDLTPEQWLQERKLYDRYKRIYAIQHGYHYLELPYNTFNKQETYKKLIDDKINEIKQIKNNQQEESA